MAQRVRGDLPLPSPLTLYTLLYSSNRHLTYTSNDTYTCFDILHPLMLLHPLTDPTLTQVTLYYNCKALNPQNTSETPYCAFCFKHSSSTKVLKEKGFHCLIPISFGRTCSCKPVCCGNVTRHTLLKKTELWSYLSLFIVLCLEA